MTDLTLFVGLDVHKKTIAVALVDAAAKADVRFYGTIANTPDMLRSLCRKLSNDGRPLHFCYEAGPCGYGVQRQLTRLGHRCDVVAPALIPRKVGDKVKTDRRDVRLCSLIAGGCASSSGGATFALVAPLRLACPKPSTSTT